MTVYDRVCNLAFVALLLMWSIKMDGVSMISELLSASTFSSPFS